MMKALTVHILDVAQGESAADLLVEVAVASDSGWKTVASQKTVRNGRCDPYLLCGEDFPEGQYRIRFFIGDYFTQQNVPQGEPKFFNEVDIVIGVGETSVHVPLLITPWSYSVYRGC